MDTRFNPFATRDRQRNVLREFHEGEDYGQAPSRPDYV